MTIPMEVVLVVGLVAAVIAGIAKGRDGVRRTRRKENVLRRLGLTEQEWRDLQ